MPGTLVPEWATSGTPRLGLAACLDRAQDEVPAAARRAMSDLGVTMTSEDVLEEAVVAVLSEHSVEAVQGRLVEVAANVLTTPDVRLTGREDTAGVPELSTIAHRGAAVRWGREVDGRTRYVGVPVLVRSHVDAVLWASTDPQSDGFDAADAVRLGLVAQAGGAAIEHALTRSEAARRGHWLEAATEVTSTVLSPVDSGTFDVIADRVRRLAGADQVWINELLPDGEHVAVMAVVGDIVEVPRGTRMPLAGSLSELATKTGRSLVVDMQAETDPLSRQVRDYVSVLAPPMASALREVFADSAAVAVVPLATAEATEGVVVLVWSATSLEAYRRLDLRIVESFAEQATVAVQLRRAREDRTRLATAEEYERISRDLHDVVIQRLFATGMTLDRVSRTSDDPVVVDRLNRVVDDLDDAMTELRGSIAALSARRPDVDDAGTMS